MLLLFLIVWAVYLSTATYSVYQMNDNRATAASAWSVATRGELSLPDGWETQMPWASPRTDGSHFTDRFPGTIAFAVPSYWLADRFGWVDEPAHHLLLNYAPAGITAATLSALAVAAMFLVLRQLVPLRPAVSGAMVFALGTGMWSVSADAMWTHGPTSLGLTLGMLALARQRSGWAGSAFAMSIVARPQTAVVAAITGLWRGVAERRMQPVLLIGVTSAIGVVLLSLYSQALFGTWLPIAGYSPGKVTAVASGSAQELLPRIANTLGHRERGVLLYTPVLTILLPFLWRGWRVAPEWVRSSAVAGFVYLLVQLRSNDWTGGAHYFGSRLTIETLVLATPLLVLTWRAATRGDRLLRTIVAIAAVASIAVHAVGAVARPISPEGRERVDQALESACEDLESEPACGPWHPPADP